MPEAQMPEVAAARAAAPHRYRALDGWRAVCAIMVVLYHFDTVSHVSDTALVRNGILYVDFFFVLSGFVIASSYGARLASGFGTWRFMALRAGRVWPLHAAVLLAFIAVEFAFSGLVSSFSATGRAAFTGPNAAAAIPPNLLLLQSMNLYQSGTWNIPSWSISVEYWTYLIFALVVGVAGRHRFATFGVIVPVCALLFCLLPGLTMGAAFQWGILRCLYGFGVGVLLCGWVEGPGRAALGRLGSLPAALRTGLELAALALATAMIAFSRDTFAWNFLPLAFGTVIVVFAAEAGAVSRLLLAAPFALLGTLSYSIYMVHYFLQLRLKNLAQLAERAFDMQLLYPAEVDGAPVMVHFNTPWAGDLATLAMLALVFAVSYATWRWIERPGQRVTRLLLSRRRPKEGSANVAS